MVPVAGPMHVDGVVVVLMVVLLAIALGAEPVSAHLVILGVIVIASAQSPHERHVPLVLLVFHIGPAIHLVAIFPVLVRHITLFILLIPIAIFVLILLRERPVLKEPKRQFAIREPLVGAP
ncbi:hypothetical protein BDY21DRAFT_331666 [Lineolata rhizophorae]|uniref:Uncharacterized protein n=1 Tax=Lineolata rhizophorae TaxID=578093 RepID=A0A6A6PCZ3_9PEZI|nr:hypothetical protein BDY21DRAFT_331666 [Lineolata rhizophorae]